MGSVFSGQKQSTPPPAPPSTVVNEIAGVEQVPVRNSDGSITYVTRRLPLTAEQKKEEAQYKSIMAEALAEIEKLSASDYENSQDVQKVLDGWAGQKEKLLERSFDTRETEEEKRLAKRGLGDSSAGLALRRLRRLDEQEAEEELSREKDLLSSDIRKQQLALQQNLYNLAAERSDLELSKVLSGANNTASTFSAGDAARRASIADYYNNRTMTPASGTDYSGIINAGATIAQSYFGGPVGTAAAVLGNLGKLF